MNDFSEIDGDGTAMIRSFDLKWMSPLSIPIDGCLIEFLNRPFLHHVVESLVQHGHRRMDFYCQGNLISYQKQLGSGARWGAEFRYITETDLAFSGSQPGSAHVFAGHTLPYSSEQPSGWLRIDSAEHYLQAQRSALTMRAESMLTIERQLDPMVWVGRNAAIHPSAILRGPVLIGENSRIGRGVVLEPNTVIGSNCLIDRNTSIENSTVFSNVYVGEGLSVKDSVVSESGITNVRLDASLEICDDLLISHFP